MPTKCNLCDKQAVTENGECLDCACKTNEKRACVIADLMLIYRDRTAHDGDDDATVLCDLLAEIGHWCDSYGVTLSSALRRAEMHYNAEQVIRLLYSPNDGQQFSPRAKEPTMNLSPRELATVLYALRVYQEDEMGAEDLRENPRFEEHEPLTDDEVDALCDRLDDDDTVEGPTLITQGAPLPGEPTAIAAVIITALDICGIVNDREKDGDMTHGITPEQATEYLAQNGADVSDAFLDDHWDERVGDLESLKEFYKAHAHDLTAEEQEKLA